MRRDADIVVVGAGIVGVATARALAESALSVVLLERFEVGHAHGSSHGTSRIFRLNYPDERFVRLARAAREEWRGLERERSVRLIEDVGVLDFGARANETARALAVCGVPFETLSAADVAARWPLRIASDETAIYQRDGGFLYADRAHATLLSAALEDGVELRERSTVSALAAGPGTIRLLLEGEELTARAVVVTAGAWAPELLAEIGIDLAVVPTRETVVYLRLEGSEHIPPVIDYGGIPAPGEGGIGRAGSAAYALPAPGRGLKAGLHHSGPVANPDDEAVTDEAGADWVAAWAAERYPGLGEAEATETCLYTNTADESFVLERHGRIVVGSACSGHGFKFAPVVGRTLAALAREAVG